MALTRAEIEKAQRLRLAAGLVGREVEAGVRTRLERAEEAVRRIERPRTPLPSLGRRIPGIGTSAVVVAPPPGIQVAGSMEPPRAGLPGLVTAPASVNVGGLPFGFTLPMQPQVLSELLYAVAPPGLAIKGVFKFQVVVAANGQTTVTVPVEPGTVTLFTAPLGVTATYYDSGIVADVFLGADQGEVEITPPPYYFPISEADHVDSVQFTYITQYLQGIITNNTATPTTLTFKVEVLAVERTLFLDQFWVPLLSKMLDLAEASASQYSRGR